MSESLRALAVLLEPPAREHAVVAAALGLPAAPGAAEIAASWPFVVADKKRAGAAIRLPVVSAAGKAAFEIVAIEDLRRAALSA